VKRVSLATIVGILALSIVVPSEIMAQSVGPAGVPGLTHNPGGGSVGPAGVPGLTHNPSGGSVGPAGVPGLTHNPSGGSVGPAGVPGLTHTPPEPWVPPAGWVDWVNEDLPDIVTAWLLAIPEILKGMPWPK